MAEGDEQMELLSEKFKGEVVISYSEEAWDEINEEFEIALVLKLANGKDFSTAAMEGMMKKAWNLQKGANFEEGRSNLAVVKFDEEKQLNKVVDSGPWHFDGSSILMARWKTDKKPEDLDFGNLKVWIQIHNLPLGFRKVERPRDLAAAAGSVIKCSTSADDIKRLKYARFQVEVDVLEPLKKGCYLRSRFGDHEWVEFSYEKMPKHCSRCLRISHGSDECNENEHNGEVRDGTEGQDGKGQDDQNSSLVMVPWVKQGQEETSSRNSRREREEITTADGGGTNAL